MARLMKSLATAALLLTLNPAIKARQAISTAPATGLFRGTYAELKGRSFKAGGLVITVMDYQSLMGACTLRLRIGNPGSQPAQVSGEDIAVMGTDQQQFLAHDNDGHVSAFQARILPGGYVEDFFMFRGSSSVKLPARLYFQGQLLAEFSK
ncbi:MAG TPA: hypothetical protein VL181_01900 [Holophagaceae bacterium]|nr:hypothetical protein [Holophagaceae bacterium]